MAGATRRAALTVGLTAAGCLRMAWGEGALRPVYPVKSALKIAVFLGGAALYAWAAGDREVLRPFRHPATSSSPPGWTCPLSRKIWP